MPNARLSSRFKENSLVSPIGASVRMVGESRRLAARCSRPARRLSQCPCVDPLSGRRPACAPESAPDASSPEEQRARRADITRREIDSTSQAPSAPSEGRPATATSCRASPAMAPRMPEACRGASTKIVQHFQRESQGDGPEPYRGQTERRGRVARRRTRQDVRLNGCQTDIHRARDGFRLAE